MAVPNGTKRMNASQKKAAELRLRAASSAAAELSQEKSRISKPSNPIPDETPGELLEATIKKQNNLIRGLATINRTNNENISKLEKDITELRAENNIIGRKLAAEIVRANECCDKCQIAQEPSVESGEIETLLPTKLKPLQTNLPTGLNPDLRGIPYGYDTLREHAQRYLGGKPYSVIPSRNPNEVTELDAWEWGDDQVESSSDIQ